MKEFIFLEETPSNPSWNWQDIWDNITEWCKSMGLRFLLALAVLIVVLILIRLLARIVRKSLRRNPKTEGVANAMYSTIRTVLNVLAIIVFLGFIGVDMAGVSSIIASCAVAVGLALQGSLSNIAGWVIIVVTRPFKLGDFITAQDLSGTVEEINLFYTHLKTPDNKVVYIPNGALSNGAITNISVKDSRRLEEVFSISYDEDPDRAIQVINSVLEKENLILRNPEPFVRVSNYADSSIDITIRVWVKGSDYWTLHWDLLEDIKKAFDENDITIPFNQYDVNINTMPGVKKDTPKKKKKEIVSIETKEQNIPQSFIDEEKDLLIRSEIIAKKKAKTKSKKKK